MHLRVAKISQMQNVQFVIWDMLLIEYPAAASEPDLQPGCQRLGKSHALAFF